MGKKRELASPEILEAASPPVGAPLAAMDMSFMREYYEQSEMKFIEPRMVLGLPANLFDRALGQELVLEGIRLSQGPPHRSLKGAHDQFEFLTTEHYFHLQELSDKAKARRKKAESVEKKKKKKSKRRQPKRKEMNQPKLVMRIIPRESICTNRGTIGQGEIPVPDFTGLPAGLLRPAVRVISVVDARDQAPRIDPLYRPVGMRTAGRWSKKTQSWSI